MTESLKHERHHPSQCQDGVPLAGRVVWEETLVVEAVEVEYERFLVGKVWIHGLSAV